MSEPIRFENLVESFERSRKVHAERPFLGTKKSGTYSYISYAQFGELVDALRGGLAGLGLAEGDRLGIIAGNSVEWAGLAYGAFGRRAGIVPMYESQAPLSGAILSRTQVPDLSRSPTAQSMTKSRTSSMKSKA